MRPELPNDFDGPVVLAIFLPATPQRTALSFTFPLPFLLLSFSGPYYPLKPLCEVFSCSSHEGGRLRRLACC